MALKAREVFLSAFVAFVAWGFLTSWAPFIRHLGHAFALGATLSLLAVGATVLLSARRKQDGRQILSTPSTNIASVAPQAWEKETTWLSDTARYTKAVLYPPSRMISEGLDELLGWLLRDYVTSWYGNITRSTAFINEIDRAIRIALINIKDQIFRLDIIEQVVSRIVPIVTAHLQDFYEAERVVRGKNLNRSVTESVELDLAIAAKYRDGKLHPAASLAYADTKLIQQEYLRRTVVRLLPELLPESMIKSRTVAVLIREIVSCAVLAPLMQILSDPDTWNQLLETYGRTVLQDRKSVRKLRAALDQHASPAPKAPKPHAFPRLATSDDERKFERFIRSIRQCNNLSEARRFRSEVASQLKRESMMEGQDPTYLRRLDTGKQLLDQKVNKLSVIGAASNARTNQSASRGGEDGSNRLLNASIKEVLYNAAGLSYFMEFMDRQRRMTMVQFWIVVDGLRNPLEGDVHLDDPFSATQSQWSDSDRLDLAQINEAYLSRPELHVPPEARDAVQAFLKAGMSATMPQYLRARTAVLNVQAGILLEMEEVHFPKFKKSDLYYKFLTSDDASGKMTGRTGERAPRMLKQPSVASIPESPGRPTSLSRLSSRFNETHLRRNANSSSDLKATAKNFDGTSGPQPRRSLDIDTSGPLFDDDLGDDPLANSIRSLDGDSVNGGETAENQGEIVEAMEAALTGIMHEDPDTDDARDEGKAEDSIRESLFDNADTSFLSPKLTDSPQSSTEMRRTGSVDHEQQVDREKPNLASLGLVTTSSRIGVFTDNDLFGDEEKFLEDEKTDDEHSAEEKPIDDEIHEAAPGDLGLAEAISALTVDIEKLAAQESVVDALTRKAELTNNGAELRILSKSKSSLQREMRRKELQRRQYIVQESDNSLYGRANVNINDIMVGREDDGQEFALYVIEVQRKAGENMPAASWAIARRYSEFHELHQRLRRVYPAVRSLDFPRRRVVMKLQRDFLDRRRSSLEQYVRQLLHLPAVCRSRDLRAFLSQSAIVSASDSSRDGERRDIVSRIYNSVTDGMDEFLGNVPVLDQLSIAGQNLISAATSQFNTMPQAAASGSGSLPIAPEDPIQNDEARAELLAFEPGQANTSRADQLEPFVKPICDIFLETFDLQRGNNWLRGRAVVVVLHQLLGGTVERKVREIARSLFAEAAVMKYLGLLKDVMWPNGQMRKESTPRTSQERAQTRVEASVMLATLVPDLAGNVVGKANAQAASRRLAATVNNERLNAHLAFVILDEMISILFPMTNRAL